MQSLPIPGPIWAAVLLTFLPTAPLPAQCGDFPEQILRASDAAAGDLFGHGLAASGDRVLIGVPEDQDAGFQSGSAWVQRHDGFQWLEEQKLRASDAAAGDWFGVSVDLEGDLAVVGAPGDADQGVGTGSAYVFRHNGTNWVQEQKLVANDGAAFDRFGWSVSVATGLPQGDQILIGAWGEDDAAADGGAAYTFRFNGSRWIQETKLTPADGGPSNWFGWSVSTAPDLVVIGTPFDDDMGIGAGAVYVYRHDGVRWRFETKLVASDGEANNNLGISVSTDGRRIVSGSWADDDVGPVSGSAYVWRDTGSKWKGDGKLLASNGVAFDQFGASVAIDQDLIVVGAPTHDDGPLDTGIAYAFRRNAGTWTEEQRLRHPTPAQEDYLGWSVAVAGDIVAAGAYLDDGAGFNAGAALVYRQAELGLRASPSSVTTGVTLSFTTCRGQPSAPVLLSVVDVSGTPTFFPVARSRFNAGGDWTLNATVPPGLSGNQFTFLSLGFAASGELLASNQDAVAFQ